MDETEESYGFGILDEATCISMAKNPQINYYSCFGMNLFELKKYKENYGKEESKEKDA